MRNLKKERLPGWGTFNSPNAALWPELKRSSRGLASGETAQVLFL